MMAKKNDILPFENAVPLEEFSKKLDASLFIFGYSNKKRPNSIILGKFDHYLVNYFYKNGTLKKSKVFSFYFRKNISSSNFRHD